MLREERALQREVVAADRRLASEFERETLLSVQESIQDLGRLASQNYLAALHWDSTGKPAKQFRHDEDLDRREIEQLARMKQLTERVADPDIRVLLHRLRTQLVEATMYGVGGTGRAEVTAAFEDAQEARDELEQAVGNRLRALVYGTPPALDRPPGLSRTRRRRSSRSPSSDRRRSCCATPAVDEPGRSRSSGS